MAGSSNDKIEKLFITLNVKRYLGNDFELIYNELGIPRNMGVEITSDEKGYTVYKVPNKDPNIIASMQNLAQSIRKSKHPRVKKVYVASE